MKLFGTYRKIELVSLNKSSVLTAEMKWYRRVDNKYAQEFNQRINDRKVTAIWKSWKIMDFLYIFHYYTVLVLDL